MNYWDNLTLIWNFLLSCMTTIFNTYMAVPVLLSVFALWVLDRIFGIFHIIKG